MSDAVYAHAQQSMAQGSKSFDMASRLFPADIRRSALMLYAWCRHCDDVIDNQVSGFQTHAVPGDPAHLRLNQLKEETLRAFRGEPMDDPVFAGFQAVVVQHAIPLRLALDHLAGYEMDVVGQRYETFEDTMLYCYRVVVGLMMAAVLNIHDPRDLERACDLGLAFQLTNIARDIVDDAAIGRCYIPEEWLAGEKVTLDQVRDGGARDQLARIATRLIAAAEPYYESAKSGLPAMSARAAWAVGAAHGVYRAIGRKVQAKGARAWDARVSTTKAEKLALLANGAQMALQSRFIQSRQRPATLWTPEHRA